MALLGIDENWQTDLFYGVALGVGLIFANVLGVFSLAVPPVASIFATNVSRFLSVILILPIIEEAFFRGLVQNFLEQILKRRWVATALQVFSFAIFHFTVYTGTTLDAFQLTSILVVGGAFLSAILFGVAMTLVSKRTKSILTVIVAHSVINFWLSRGVFVII